MKITTGTKFINGCDNNVYTITAIDGDTLTVIDQNGEVSIQNVDDITNTVS